MSEDITFTAGTATIYGSLADARAYLGMERVEWDLATDAEISTEMKRALVKATRYIDRLAWGPDYLTFADRDAVVAIQQASYELAALLYDDDTALDAFSTDGVSSISAGGDSVTYALGVTRTPVPGLAWSLILPYLATALDDGGIDAPDGQEGCTINPFSLGRGKGDCSC